MSKSGQLRLFSGSALNTLWLNVIKVKMPVVWTLGFGLLVVGGVFGVSHMTNKPMSYLTIDPADVGLPAYVGMLSNLGIMVWGIATGVCLLAWMVLLSIPNAARETRFFLLSGLISACLMIDDGYLLHDRIFPDVLGIPEIVVFLAYGSLFLSFLYAEYETIGRSEYPLLILAAGCVGLSGGIDTVFPFSDIVTAVEDSVKFVGILFWFVYFVRTANKAIHRRPGV